MNPPSRPGGREWFSKTPDNPVWCAARPREKGTQMEQGAILPNDKPKWVNPRRQLLISVKSKDRLAALRELHKVTNVTILEGLLDLIESLPIDRQAAVFRGALKRD